MGGSPRGVPSFPNMLAPEASAGITLPLPGGMRRKASAAEIVALAQSGRLQVHQRNLLIANLQQQAAQGSLQAAQALQQITGSSAGAVAGSVGGQPATASALLGATGGVMQGLTPAQQHGQGSLMAQSAALMGMSAPMSLPQQGPTSAGAATHLLQQQRAGGAGGQQQANKGLAAAPSMPSQSTGTAGTSMVGWASNAAAAAAAAAAATSNAAAGVAATVSGGSSAASPPVWKQSSLSPVSPGLYNLTRGSSSRPLPVLSTAAGNATMAGAAAHTIMNGQQQPPTEAGGSMPLKPPSASSHSAATMRAAMAQRQLQSQSRHRGATPAGALLGPKKGLLENAGAPALAAGSAATPAKDTSRPS
eukprot:SM000014S00234  [mRNA]  locus=s14:58848:61197:- [translate_table: standard]